MKKQEVSTRKRILETATELIWKRSYATASVDEICKSADCRKGSFYYFFDSKSDLAVESIKGSWQRVEQEVFISAEKKSHGGMSTISRLVKSIEKLQSEVMTSDGHFAGCPFGGLGQEMAGQDEKIRLAVHEIFEAHCDFLTRAIKRAIEKGEIGSCDPHKKARQLFALLEGGLLIAKVANDPALFKVAVSGIDRLLVRSK